MISFLDDDRCPITLADAHRAPEKRNRQLNAFEIFSHQRLLLNCAWAGADVCCAGQKS
jgi:hypothetical protein